MHEYYEVIQAGFNVSSNVHYGHTFFYHTFCHNLWWNKCFKNCKTVFILFSHELTHVSSNSSLLSPFIVAVIVSLLLLDLFSEFHLIFSFLKQ